MIGHLNPLKRGGEPIEIAEAALFLASDDRAMSTATLWWSTAASPPRTPIYRQEYGRTSF